MIKRTLLSVAIVAALSAPAVADPATDYVRATREMLWTTYFCREAIGNGAFLLARTVALRDLTAGTGNAKAALDFVESTIEAGRKAGSVQANATLCYEQISELQYQLRAAKMRMQ